MALLDGYIAIFRKKSPIISGFVAERDLQLKVSYASELPFIYALSRELDCIAILRGKVQILKT